MQSLYEVSDSIINALQSVTCNHMSSIEKRLESFSPDSLVQGLGRVCRGKF